MFRSLCAASLLIACAVCWVPQSKTCAKPLAKREPTPAVAPAPVAALLGLALALSTAATPANNDSCGLRSDGGQAKAPHQRGVKAS